MARAMNMFGHATGHEWVYNLEGNPRWANLFGESSWPAAPLIEQVDSPLAVVHVTRNPIDVVASVHNSNFLRSECTCGHEVNSHRSEPYVQYALKYLPDLWDIHPDPIRAAAWVIMWNRLVETKSHGRPYRLVKIEDASTDPAVLVEVVLFLTGIAPSVDLAKEVQSMIPNNLNSHRFNPEPIIGWDDIPSGYWKDQLGLMIKDYGYGD